MNDKVFQLDYYQTSLMYDVINTTIIRQQNYIARQSIIVNDLDNKIAELKVKIEQGKKGLFNDPSVELIKLSQKRTKLLEPLETAKTDLKITRKIFEKILEVTNVFNESKEKLLEHKAFIDRKVAVMSPGHKDYFYSDIG
jgi:hypothetical protein